MKRVLLAFLIILAIGLLLFGVWPYSRPSAVGVWKGTDQYGHEHYFEFHRYGRLAYWSRIRQDDGFKEAGRFRGSYRWEGRKTVELRKEGFPPDGKIQTLASVRTAFLSKKGVSCNPDV